MAEKRTFEGYKSGNPRLSNFPIPTRVSSRVSPFFYCSLFQNTFFLYLFPHILCVLRGFFFILQFLFYYYLSLELGAVGSIVHSWRKTLGDFGALSLDDFGLPSRSLCVCVCERTRLCFCFGFVFFHFRFSCLFFFSFCIFFPRQKNDKKSSLKKKKIVSSRGGVFSIIVLSSCGPF